MCVSGFLIIFDDFLPAATLSLFIFGNELGGGGGGGGSYAYGDSILVYKVNRSSFSWDEQKRSDTMEASPTLLWS